MAKYDYLRVVGIVEGLLTPIQNIIMTVLPEFIEKELELEKDEVREEFVKVVDKLLVAQYPGTLLDPEKMRKSIIRALLDIILDKILLPATAD
jgi:hypothetical protein